MSETFAFGDFELDTARFELRRGGQVLEVQPKVLRLLSYLIAHRERAVPGDELLRELWSEATVTAGSVKRAVLGARHALGEKSEGTSSIRTVRGLGYQFVRDDVRVSGKRSLPAAESVSDNPRFLGREALLATLLPQLDAAESGSILLTGAPGIGKTRMAEELWTRASQRGAHVWIGRCTSLHGAPSLWPVQQVARDALRELGAERFREMLGSGGAEVAQALPELHTSLGKLPRPTAITTRSQRFRMFDSICLFLRNVAEHRPIVLGFDDLHHADAPSLQLLTFLVRQLGAARVLIVGTFRHEAQKPSDTVSALDELLRQDRTRCIELSGFEPTELARYVAVATGVSLPEATLRELHTRTGGNPLFVRQLVESWRAGSPALEPQALELATHSVDLRGAIQRHLEVLPEDCHALLRAAAVLGREFSGALLSRVLDQPLDTVWAGLAQATSVQLVEPTGEHGRFRFTHSLISDALYRQLAMPERARLHGRAGDMLEVQGVGNDYVLLSEVTRHYVAAAPLHDTGRALLFTLRAADSALSRLAYEEAAAHFERALSLQQYQAPTAQARMSLLLRRAEALARTSALAAARVALFDVLALAREHNAVEVAYAAATLLAERPETGSVDTEQVAALQHVLDALPESDERRLLLQAAVAKSLAYGRERTQRSELAHAALRGARQLDNVPLRTAVLTRCHEALLGPEHLQERVQIAAELMQLAQKSGDSAQLLRASSTQIETCIERGDMDAVERAVSAMETLAEYVREPYFRWHAKALRSTQAMVHGQMAHAEERANEALALGTPLGEELARHMYCTQLIGILQLQNRMPEAERIVREMSLRYPSIAGWNARVGVIDHGLGRVDAARRRMEDIMARHSEWLVDEPFALSALCSIAELCCWVPEENAAKLLYRELSPYADHIGLTHLGAASYGPVHRLLAMLAAFTGDFALSERHFESALNVSTAMRSPTFWAVTGVAYAEVLVLAGGSSRRARAVSLMRRVEVQAERHQLAAVSDYARTAVRQYNLRNVHDQSVS